MHAGAPRNQHARSTLLTVSQSDCYAPTTGSPIRYALAREGTMNFKAVGENASTPVVQTIDACKASPSLVVRQQTAHSLK